MDVERCYFHYSLTDNAKCGECCDNIRAGDLRVKCDGGDINCDYYSQKFYHFDCFWKSERCFKKDEIMIEIYICDKTPSNYDNDVVKKFKVFGQRLYASLEVLEKNLSYIKLGIKQEDVERVRQKFASAPDGHVFIQHKISRFEMLSCCSFEYDALCRCIEDVCLMFDQRLFHPRCLAENGFLNFDAHEIVGYNSLASKKKKILDDLFKKDKKLGLLFIGVNKFVDEHCGSYYSCKETHKLIRNEELKIRYKKYCYHVKCFAEMCELNVDGKDIPGYDKLNDSEKEIVDQIFIKSDDLDIPVIEKSQKDNYCNAAECCMSETATKILNSFDPEHFQALAQYCRDNYHPACFKTSEINDNVDKNMKNDDLGYCMSQAPSKFPYPYTISKGQPQIRYFNDLYHPTCFKASGISDIAAKDMKNYESLTDEEKQDFDELFKPKKRRFEEDESVVASKDNEEPLTKKKKSLDEETGTENVEQEVTTIQTADDRFEKPEHSNEDEHSDRQEYVENV